MYKTITRSCLYWVALLVCTFSMASLHATTSSGEETNGYCYGNNRSLITVKNESECKTKVYCHEISANGKTYYMGYVYPGKKIHIRPSAKKARIYTKTDGEETASFTTSKCGQTKTLEVKKCGSECTGEIDEIVLYKSNNFQTIKELKDGGTYYLEDLPSNFGMETKVKGNVESVSYEVNGHKITENIYHYTYPAGDANWHPSPGTYTIKVAVYSKDNKGGKKCDEKHITIKLKLKNECKALTKGGKIKSTQTKCAAFDPVPFIGNKLHDPNGGKVTYQWQIKEVKGGEWMDIPGANGKDYDPPFQESGSVWYRRTANNECGKMVASNAVDIHVKDCGMPCDGSIKEIVFYSLKNGEDDVTINNGGEYFIEDLPSSFNIEAITQGTVGSVKFNLTGGTSLTHTENHKPYRLKGDHNPLKLGVGHYTLRIRAYAKDKAEGEKCDDQTITFKIKECVKLTDGGHISETQKECGSFDPDTFTGDELTDPNGGTVTYQWQIKEVKGGDWMDIQGANQKDYDPPFQASGSVWYRRTATNDCGKVVVSNVVDIHVKIEPDPSVEAIDPECGEDTGMIMFTFGDTEGRTNIEFQVAQNGNIIRDFNSNNTKDDNGSFKINDLAPGKYTVAVRWGNNECEVDLGEVTIEEPIDSDDDGLCDEEDCKPEDPNLPGNPGDSCDDGNPETLNDVIVGEDGCGCQGECPELVPVDITELESCPGDEVTVTFTTNAPFDPYNFVEFYAFTEPQLDPYTSTDTKRRLGEIQNTGGVQSFSTDKILARADVYYVYGCFKPTPTNCPEFVEFIVTVVGDSDNDGACDLIDCAPNDPMFPGNPGDSCDDGNPETLNDVIVGEDGCGCQGECPELEPVDITELESCPGDEVTVTFTTNAPFDPYNFVEFYAFTEPQLDPYTSTDTKRRLGEIQNTGGVQSFSTDKILARADVYYVYGCFKPTPTNCPEFVEFIVTVVGDSDNDGTCDLIDCAPNDPMFPADLGSPCDDGNIETINDMIVDEGCGCEGTCPELNVIGDENLESCPGELVTLNFTTNAPFDPYNIVEFYAFTVPQTNPYTSTDTKRRLGEVQNVEGDNSLATDKILARPDVYYVYGCYKPTPIDCQVAVQFIVTVNDCTSNYLDNGDNEQEYSNASSAPFGGTSLENSEDPRSATIGSNLNGGLKIYQNKPNPFTRQTDISFELPNAGTVSLYLTDLSGQSTKIKEGHFNSGYNKIRLNRDNLNAGIYYYTIQTEVGQITKKLVILD